MRFATSELLHPAQVEELRAAAGHADLIVTTPQRVMELTTAAYRAPGIEARHRPPAHAAAGDVGQPGVSRGQEIALVAVAAVLVAAFALWLLGTATALLAAMTTYYLVNSLYKFKLAFDSLSVRRHDRRLRRRGGRRRRRARCRATRCWAPLYKEAGIVGLLTHNILGRLDYPASKLEVLLLCEEDDDETIAAIQASNLPDNYHLVRVPEGQPQTKPKACNFALRSRAANIS